MNNLKKFRMMMGMTQADLSKKSGIKVRTIGSWEDGSVSLANATFVNVIRLSAALEVDPVELVGGDLNERL